MASNRSKSSPKTKTRPALSFEMAAQLCPNDGLAQNVAERFGLALADDDAMLVARSRLRGDGPRLPRVS